MIFKTFDSKIDKWTAKIGIFGKSFNELGTAINEAFKSVIDNLDNYDENVRFWESLKNNLFSKSADKDWIKNSLGDIISKENIDSYLKELDLNSAKNKLKEIFDWEEDVKNNETTWEKFFDTCKGGNEYLIALIKNTDDLSKLTGEDLVKANQQARASAIAHNEALQAQTFSAKASSVALKALSIAGNMIAMWAISKGIELAVKGIDELAHSAEHCKERVEDLISSYESSLKSANNNAKTVEDTAAKYEKLSQGVNNLGQNVSLTEAEYAEYNEIVNQIAEMFPTLIQGYTDEGNAILSLKGNVDSLRDAYKDAQKEAYNMLIVSGNDSDGNDIIKNWKNINDTSTFSKIFDLGAADVGGKISVKDALAQLEALSNMTAETYRNIERVTGAGTRKEILALSDIEKDIGYGSYISKALGIDGNVTDEEFANAKREAKALIQTYQAEVDSALKNVQTLANAYLVTNDDYSKLDSEMKNAASIIVNSINENIADGFEDKTDVGAYVEKIVDILQDNPDVHDALVGLFQLDIEDMQPQEAKSLVDIYINKIAEILEEDPVQLKTRLEFEDVDTIADNYASVLEKAAKKFSGYMPANPSWNPDSLQAELSALDEFAKENSINTQDEIAFWNQCLEESKTREEAMNKYLESSTAGIEGKDPITFASLMVDSDENEFLKGVDSHIEKVNALTTALSALREGDFESADFITLAKQFPELADDSNNLEHAITDLLGSMNSTILDEFQNKFGELDTDEDRVALKAFQDAVIELGKVVGSTEFAIDISAESDGMDKLFTAMKESVSSTGLTADSIKALKSRFQELEGFDSTKLFERTYNGIHLNTKALRELESEYEKQKKAGIDRTLDDLAKQYNHLTAKIDRCSDASKKAELYQNRNDLLQQIEDTTLLASQYEGLTSAFYKWEQAQSIGEEGDMYDSLAGGLENIKELFQDGLIGTNKFRSAVQLMSNEDLSTASVDKLLEAYDTGYSKMEKYFKDSSDGCLNFLNDVQNLNSEWVKLNSDGSWDINFGVGDDKKVADALGLNVETIQSILRKLSDYGFDIDLDSIYSKFDLLQTKAEKANQTLFEMGKIKTSFNLNTADLDFVISQIKDAQELLDTFRKSDGTVDLKLDGATETQDVLVALISKKQALSEPSIMSIDTSKAESDIGNTIRLLQDFQQNYNDLEIQTAVGADTAQAQTNIQNIINSLSNVPDEIKTALGFDDVKFQEALEDIRSTEIDIETGAKLNEESVESIVEKISEITPEMVVTAGLDSKLVDDYIPEDKDAIVTYDYDDSRIRSYDPPDKEATVNYRESYQKVPAIPPKPTMAHASGTDGTLKRDEEAIINELGEEGLIRDGVLTKIIGGMQKIRLKAGDIILNHRQMEELEKDGYVTSNNGRAKQVNAYSGGSGKIIVGGSVKTTGKSSDSSSDTTKEAKETAETFNWIEKAISRVQRTVKNFGSTVSTTWKNWKDRNDALISQLGEVRKEISLQQSAYQSYMNAAESVGLSDHYKSLVRNGTMSIEDITDDALKEQIKSYQEW